MRLPMPHTTPSPSFFVLSSAIIGLPHPSFNSFVPLILQRVALYEWNNIILIIFVASVAQRILV